MTKKSKRLLNKLRMRLYRGLEPQDWPDAEHIGCGCYTNAYRVDDFVIKRRGWRSHVEPRWSRERIRLELAFFGMMLPDEWRVGRWVIQPYYKPLRGLEPEYWDLMTALDIHYFNVGRDDHGNLRAFDY